MLKTACGMVAAKRVAGSTEGATAGIPERWVSILSGELEWPALWGMYAAISEGRMYHSSSVWYESFVHLLSGQVLATRMIINGVVLYLLLGRADHPSAFGVHRPRTLNFEQDGIEKFAELSWANPSFNHFIRFSRVGKYDGPPPDWPAWAREG